MSKEDIKTPSVLAFERKLLNSDGLMYCCSWNTRTHGMCRPISIEAKDVRGTISNRLKTAAESDPAKLDAKIQNPNLQRVDVAALPFDADTLQLSFTLRVLGDIGKPCACNDTKYQEALIETINEYQQSCEFKELANRYAANIANARFLWRNRIGAEAIEVHVKRYQQEKIVTEWTFDAHDCDLRSFSEPSGALAELAEAIRQCLTGESFSFFTIEAYARLGSGQEVFPSQELILDRSGDNKKSKTLYQVGEIAAIHSQKIGNALRTIDTWYDDAAELGPIAIEPYGSVTSQGRAYRQPKDKVDFYSLLDGWIIKKKVPAVEQQHYVVATLIRGGVFGEKES